MERVLFIRAALFWWMTFLLLALSTREIAVKIFFLPPFFLAILMAVSRRVRITVLTSSFLLETLSARLAVLVTGILNYIS